MDERADQMVLDYLRRVGDVAHKRLRADERLDFVTRLRTRIDHLRTEADAVQPEETRQVIARFGDPSRLVERERRRLEQEREQERHQTEEQPAGLREGRVAAAEASETDPSTQPIPIVGEVRQPADSPEQREPSQPPPSVEERRPDQPPPNAAPWLRRSDPGPDERAPDPRPAPAAEPDASAPREEPVTYETTGRTLPGMPGVGASMSSTDIRALVNRHRVETAAITLLGLGGLIVPFPYTLVPLATGAACLGLARGWARRDKLIGIGAPIVGLLLGVFVVGAATKSGDVAVDIAAYAGAITGHGMTFVRVGALAGAGYLAYQLFRSAATSGARSG